MRLEGSGKDEDIEEGEWKNEELRTKEDTCVGLPYVSRIPSYQEPPEEGRG